MQFTELGEMAHKCALEIPHHFPFVIINEFVVMPNHVHLLFTIDKSDGNDDGGNVETQNRDVETQNIASLPSPSQIQPINMAGNKFGPQTQNVASIIRGYKIGVTKFARQQGFDFRWQNRYHDRIVRNGAEYERIRGYIQQNVTTWDVDINNI